MGTLFSSFQIARSGMQIAQIQLDVAGHNIANVNKPGFSRQRVELISRVPLNRPHGQIGRGVAISNIVQIRDAFLDSLFRRQVAGRAEAEIRAEFFARIEDVFLEPSDTGLATRLNGFFDALNDFASNSESIPVRQGVLSEAQVLAALLRESGEQLRLLRTDANQEIINFVPTINGLTERIARMNIQIRDSEVGGSPANDLRDDRGVLLDELAEIVSIFTREREDGQIDVLVSGEILVTGGQARELETVRNPALDLSMERNDLVEVRFLDNGTLFSPQRGNLFGAFDVRDNAVVEIDNRLDAIAATIIEQINRIHTVSNGLVNLSGTITAGNAVTDSSVALNVSGLPFTMTAGTFDITIFDSTGTIVSTTNIAIDPAITTLDGFAAGLSASVPQISATVNSSGRLEITVAAGFSLAFSNDTSNVLTSVAVNALFNGFDARTIEVNQGILDNPQLLASGFDLDVLNTGDNRAALAMADVRNGLFLDGNTTDINAFYETTIVQLGVDARANRQSLEVERTFVQGFARRRLEISGVSLDEEVTNLLQFQRAFEASARVITVTDRMLDALMAIAI